MEQDNKLDTMICPICEEGIATSFESLEPFVISGHTFMILTKWKNCDSCGSDFADHHDVIFNHIQVNNVRKALQDVEIQGMEFPDQQNLEQSTGH